MKEDKKIEFDGMSIPVLEIEEQAVAGLPDPEPDTYFIVSGIVAAAAKRDDVLAPSRTQRDKDGRVTECRALIQPKVLEDEADEVELEEETNGTDKQD